LRGVEAGEIIPPLKPLHLETKVVKALESHAKK